MLAIKSRRLAKAEPAVSGRGPQQNGRNNHVLVIPRTPYGATFNRGGPPHTTSGARIVHRRKGGAA
jgi:hypothetical protein